jgi:hypothetical protein
MWRRTARSLTRCREQIETPARLPCRACQAVQRRSIQQPPENALQYRDRRSRRDQDNDQLYVNTEAAQDTSFQEIVELTQRVADIVRSDPDIESFQASAGGGSGRPGPSSANTGRMRNSEGKKLQKLIAGLPDVTESLRTCNSAIPCQGPTPPLRKWFGKPSGASITCRNTCALRETMRQQPDSMNARVLNPSSFSSKSQSGESKGSRRTARRIGKTCGNTPTPILT